MGKPRSSHLQPLPINLEMSLIARGLGLAQTPLPKDAAGRDVIDRLAKLKPQHRRLMGKQIELMRDSFDAAYPGQTRTRRIPNRTWEKAGYPQVARVNRLLGLEGC